MKKKGVKKGFTIEEKVIKVEEWFHHHPEPFVLKELLSLLPKHTGVIFQSIPEVLELLVSEERLSQEKIGIQTLIWWFPKTKTQIKLAEATRACGSTISTSITGTGRRAAAISTSCSGSGTGWGGRGRTLGLTPSQRLPLHHPRGVGQYPALWERPQSTIFSHASETQKGSARGVLSIRSSFHLSSSALHQYYLTLSLLSLRTTRDALTQRISILEQQLEEVDGRFHYPSRQVRIQQNAALEKLRSLKSNLIRQQSLLKNQEMRRKRISCVRSHNYPSCTATNRNKAGICAGIDTSSGSIFFPTLSSSSLSSSALFAAGSLRTTHSRPFCSSSSSALSASLPSPSRRESFICHELRVAIVVALNASQRWTENFLLLEEDVLQRRPHLTSSLLRQSIIGDAKQYKDGNEGHELDFLSTHDWKCWKPYLPLNTKEEEEGGGPSSSSFGALFHPEGSCLLGGSANSTATLLFTTAACASIGGADNPSHRRHGGEEEEEGGGRELHPTISSSTHPGSARRLMEGVALPPEEGGALHSATTPTAPTPSCSSSSCEFFSSGTLSQVKGYKSSTPEKAIIAGNIDLPQHKQKHDYDKASTTGNTSELAPTTAKSTSVSIPNHSSSASASSPPPSSAPLQSLESSKKTRKHSVSPTVPSAPSSHPKSRSKKGNSSSVKGESKKKVFSTGASSPAPLLSPSFSVTSGPTLTPSKSEIFLQSGGTVTTSQPRTTPTLTSFSVLETLPLELESNEGENKKQDGKDEKKEEKKEEGKEKSKKEKKEKTVKERPNRKRQRNL